MAGRHRLRVSGEALTGAWEVGTRASLIVVAVLIVQLFVHTFVAQAYQVPSASMENTLKVGDVLVVSRSTPRLAALHHGDIIVFRDPGGWVPADEQPVTRNRSAGAAATARSILTFVGLLPANADANLVKRVIGLPGDVVSCDGTGALTVNGSRLTERYVYPGDAACTSAFHVTVPSGGLWVMGDHRSDSADSRYHRNLHDGAVPISDVLGLVVAVLSHGHLRLV
ncbi:MAG TPA: signal peptidase I [Rugosimonospora sp.]|nr:signal peptidase I [Rugosimonospora sp.]